MNSYDRAEKLFTGSASYLRKTVLKNNRELNSEIYVVSREMDISLDRDLFKICADAHHSENVMHNNDRMQVMTAAASSGINRMSDILCVDSKKICQTDESRYIGALMAEMILTERGD